MPRTGRFSPGKDPVHMAQEAAWVPGRSGRVRKISPPPRFDPQTVQLVASRSTNWAVPALSCAVRAGSFSSTEDDFHLETAIKMESFVRCLVSTDCISLPFLALNVSFVSRLRAAVRTARRSVQTPVHHSSVCHPSAILSPLLLPTEQNKEIQAKIIIYHTLHA